jgi:hypothetical protein
MNDYSSNGGFGQWRIGEDLGYGCREGEEWKGRRWGRSGLEREIRRRLHVLVAGQELALGEPSPPLPTREEEVEEI